MSLRRFTTRSAGAAHRIGLFGLLGSGNLGNDGSLEAVLAFLRAEHPDAVLSARVAGPERVTARYGIPASQLYWYQRYDGRYGRLTATPLKLVGKVLDAVRTAAWVRRQDVVIVPGMGVLEASVPLRPWRFPYALLLLCASGRLLGTKVALVGVGAEDIPERALRWPITLAARCAHYRSYRDGYSRDAMHRMGVHSSGDQVYADLAFALPAPAERPPATGTVGIGVMAYHGGNGDRARAGQLHREYVDTLRRFVRWLVDGDRRVLLFTGDQVDDGVVAELVADLHEHRPTLEPSRVMAASAATLDELQQRMAAVDTLVATRYHNVVCGLKLAKPTLSIGYALKNDVLMARFGLAEFCQRAHSVDFDLLVEQFTALEDRREQFTESLVRLGAEVTGAMDDQFAALSAALFPARERPAGDAAPATLTLTRGSR